MARDEDRQDVKIERKRGKRKEKNRKLKRTREKKKRLREVVNYIKRAKKKF